MGKPWSGPPPMLALALVLVSCRHGSSPATTSPASGTARPAVPLCAPSPTDEGPPENAQWRAYRQKVVSIVRGQSRSLEACYTEALKVDASATARLTFEWTINVRGAVEAVCVTKQPDEKASILVRCLALIVRGWTFPPPGNEPVDVSFPFVFQTAPDEPSHQDEPRAPEKVAP
jgi:hypothetical protein